MGWAGWLRGRRNIYRHWMVELMLLVTGTGPYLLCCGCGDFFPGEGRCGLNFNGIRSLRGELSLGFSFSFDWTVTIIYFEPY